MGVHSCLHVCTCTFALLGKNGVFTRLPSLFKINGIRRSDIFHDLHVLRSCCVPCSERGVRFHCCVGGDVG